MQHHNSVEFDQGDDGFESSDAIPAAAEDAAGTHAPRQAAFWSAPEVGITASHSNRTLATRGCAVATVSLLSLGHVGGHLHGYHDGAGHGSVVEARAGRTALLCGLHRGRIRVVVAASVALIIRSLGGATVV